MKERIHTPLVTIIMATHNRAHLIMETLASIQEQKYKNFECLIIDDGGTDNTLEVITPLLENDKRFQYLKRQNSYLKGLPGCRNQGLDMAKGDYIIFFDDDDIVHPKNLETCISAFRPKGQIDFCCYGKSSFAQATPIFSFQNETLAVEGNIDKTDILKILTNEIPMASCCVMWERGCFKDVRFNDSLMYAEEWECYSKIISNGKKGVLLSNVLYFNRKHPNSNTGEFWRKDPIRVASKKAAILLVAKNLSAKKLFSPSLQKYLVGLSISYRDRELTKQILKEAPLTPQKSWGYHFKYYLFPLWQVYYKLKKTALT